MIEPNMATMLVYLMTDAELPKAAMKPMLKRVVDRTFNCMSIDTDTSTSDTVVLMANGLAGKVKLPQFEKGLVPGLRISHPRNRPQRRRRDQTHHRRRQSRQDGCASATGGEVGRQFAAGENRGLRLRSQLGPGDHGSGQDPSIRASTRPKSPFDSAPPPFSKKAPLSTAISKRCGNISASPKLPSASSSASAKHRLASGAAI